MQLTVFLQSAAPRCTLVVDQSLGPGLYSSDTHAPNPTFIVYDRTIRFMRPLIDSGRVDWHDICKVVGLSTAKPKFSPP